MTQSTYLCQDFLIIITTSISLDVFTNIKVVFTVFYRLQQYGAPFGVEADYFREGGTSTTVLTTTTWHGHGKRVGGRHVLAAVVHTDHWPHVDVYERASLDAGIARQTVPREGGHSGARDACSGRIEPNLLDLCCKLSACGHGVGWGGVGWGAVV
jgi:hypothetical protein